MSQNQMQGYGQQMSPQSNGYPSEQPPINLLDLIDRILDKGLVVDLYVKISLVGIELLEIQARVVVAGIQTYLRYAREMSMMGLIAKPYQGRGLLQNLPQQLRPQQRQQQQQQQQGQQGQRRGGRGVNIPVSSSQNMRRQVRPMMSPAQRQQGR